MGWMGSLCGAILWASLCDANYGTFVFNISFLKKMMAMMNKSFAMTVYQVQQVLRNGPCDNFSKEEPLFSFQLSSYDIYIFQHNFTYSLVHLVWPTKHGGAYFSAVCCSRTVWAPRMLDKIWHCFSIYFVYYFSKTSWLVLMWMVRFVTFVHRDMFFDKYFWSSKGEIHLKILQATPLEPICVLLKL